jgi:hypothetical protein
MHNILVGILKETDYYGDRGIDRTIGVIIKMDVKEVRCEDVDWTWYRGGPCEHNVTCRGGCVTYKMGFGLGDWIYCTLHIHTIRDYRQHSATADLHTLQFTVPHALRFSVFTSRILVTDL